MDRCRATWGVFLLAASGSLVMAAPATAPVAETAPAVMVDLSSPKAAILSLYGALRAGDIASARRCLHFADARQEETFELNVMPLWTPLRLMHAMEARFGAGAREQFSCASLEKTVDKAVEDLGRAEIAVNGDSAVIAEKKAAVDPTAETEITGITLKRNGDQWQVVAATFPDLTAEIPAQQVPVIRALADAVSAACQSTLERLGKGEFKSAAEAYGAYQDRLRAGVLKVENRAPKPK